jgi:glucose-6-phosphate isomerase
VTLAIYNDQTQSERLFEYLQKDNTVVKLQALDSRARRKGLAGLDPYRNPLISIGMEIQDGGVVKNGYGVFDLAWQAERHPEWANMVLAELDEIRRRIREANSAPLQYVIWAGMGGSAEDKSMYNAVGLLRRGPRVYVLDSTDPAKLRNILADIHKRSRQTLAASLRRTLVVGMAMGMTSYEPVVNLEKLAALYDRHRIDSRANFVYLTLPGSLLDQFAGHRGYRKIELQLDGGNTTAGRHSAPLTRGSLYPLGLCGVELTRWIAATAISTEQIATALRLASFLHSQGAAGRDKVRLVLPKQWSGAALWTKQDFEESLGKSEELGIKIVIGEKIRLTNYRAPKDSAQDCCMLGVQVKGLAAADAERIALARRAGYPAAILTLPRDAQLSSYMQFIHYVVFGIARLRNMNFVTQPSVELYKAITNKLHAEAVKVGGIEHTREWKAAATTPRRAEWRGRVTLRYDRLPDGPPMNATAPQIYAALLNGRAGTRSVEYGELTFFGDTRYSPQGKAVRKVLERAGDKLFRGRLKMPVDIYEGPAMNHSYHEMIIGHGRCFSTILISAKPDAMPEAGYTSDYHRAQFLATQMALAQRGRDVVSITLRDLERASLAALDEFFRQAVRYIEC